MKITIGEKTEREHFDMLANSYDVNYGYMDPFTKYKINKKSKKIIDAIRNFGSNNKSIKILEIGCGTGEYTRHIAKSFPESSIYGLDISPQILEIAKRKCAKHKNVKFIAKSAYDTGLKTESIDVLFGFYVLHHLDLEKFRKEAYRVLKPSGLLFFYEPNLLNPIVFLIKSTPLLKRIIGDSPGEWAINPLTIQSILKNFVKINISTSEYIIPIKVFPFDFKRKIDFILERVAAKIPLVNQMGGSVCVLFKKKQ